jgi:multidrug resistance efflux pump
VNTGDFVNRRQPLKRIDRTDLAFAIAAQAAAVTSAEARAVRTGNNEVRFRALFSAGVIVAQSYDQAKEAAKRSMAVVSRKRKSPPPNPSGAWASRRKSPRACYGYFPTPRRSSLDIR